MVADLDEQDRDVAGERHLVAVTGMRVVRSVDCICVNYLAHRIFCNNLATHLC
jgi:hypothetical protein